MKTLAATSMREVYLRRATVCSVLIVCAVCMVLVLGGCKKCVESKKENMFNEPVTHKRGVEVNTSRRGASSANSGIGGFLSVLIQPLVLGGQSIERRTYVHALYIDSAYAIGQIALALQNAPPGERSTCKPHWRLDLDRRSAPLTVHINESCGLLEMNGRFYAYTAEVRRVISKYLKRSVRAPTHRIVRLRVDVALSKQRVFEALRTIATRAYAPGLPYIREPYVKVSTVVREPLPADLTQLDEEVGKVRQTASALLRRYAQGLVDSRPEVERFEGPYPIKESFTRDLRVKYGVTIVFRASTDGLTMRYHCSHLEFHIDKVVVPKHYRIDAVFPVETKISEVKKIISGLRFDETEPSATRNAPAGEKPDKTKKKKKAESPKITLWKGGLR
jgi:hypothetical protein